MFGKSRDVRATCSSCQRQLDDDAKICSCGVATDRMSHEERNAYEVERWRAYRARVEATG